jgi:hypothetical protein
MTWAMYNPPRPGCGKLPKKKKKKDELVVCFGAEKLNDITRVMFSGAFQ